MAIVSHHSVLIASACVGGDGHVVAHGDVVEPGGLAGLGDLHELGRAGARAPTAARRSCSATGRGAGGRRAGGVTRTCSSSRGRRRPLRHPCRCAAGRGRRCGSTARPAPAPRRTASSRAASVALAQEAAERERHVGRVTAGRLGRRGDLGHPLVEQLAGQPEREEPVAEAPGPAGGARAVPADEDRDRAPAPASGGCARGRTRKCSPLEASPRRRARSPAAPRCPRRCGCRARRDRCRAPRAPRASSPRRRRGTGDHPTAGRWWPPAWPAGAGGARAARGSRCPAGAARCAPAIQARRSSGSGMSQSSGSGMRPGVAVRVAARVAGRHDDVLDREQRLEADLVGVLRERRPSTRVAVTPSRYGGSSPSRDHSGRLDAGDAPGDLAGHRRRGASAVRMPQNSKPYWWAAVWASIDTRMPADAIGSSAWREPPVGLRRAGDVGQRVGDVVEQADADLLEATVALVGGEVHDPQHRPVVVPEREERVDQRERRCRRRRGPSTSPSVMIVGEVLRPAAPSPRRARGWPPRRRRSTGRRSPATCPPRGRCR